MDEQDDMLQFLMTLKLYKKSVSERSTPQSVFFQANNFASVLIHIKY